MGLTNKALSDLTIKDLNQLIESGVQEGPLIEYKSKTYGKADADKKEFLKDISSFANHHGGHLILGISETGGVPNELSPIVGTDADSERLRLESLARDDIEPRIVGIQMTSIQVGESGFVIIIRIPKSWNAHIEPLIRVQIAIILGHPRVLMN